MTEKLGQKCPKCNSKLVKRRTKYSRFLSCSLFPKCRYTQVQFTKEPDETLVNKREFNENQSHRHASIISTNSQQK